MDKNINNLEIKGDQLRDALIQFCIQHGLTGACGTFRIDDGTLITLWTEAPHCRNGLLKDLAGCLSSIIGLSGADTISSSEGLIKPAKKG